MNSKAFSSFSRALLSTALLLPAGAGAESPVADAIAAVSAVKDSGVPVAEHKAVDHGAASTLTESCRPNFTALINKVGKSVVNISGEGERKSKRTPRGRGGPDRSAGSGFIVSADGYVVTNYHVVQESEKIVIRMVDDKREHPAELIGYDDKTDLALLKLEGEWSDLPAVQMGDSDALEIGEWVLAVGNQFQLGQTVTAGIVSAKARRVPTRISGPYDNFIQTDASINPGSSGGPLFNIRGEVIGINTAIFSPGRGPFGSGFNIGIGFSIPVNMATRVLEQLKTEGKVTRGMLGVVIQPINADLGEALKYDSLQGALVAHIVKGSPAYKAGFRMKDIILSYNGVAIRDHDDLPILVANTPIGETARIEVLRNKRTVVLTPTIQVLDTNAFPDGKKKEKAEVEFDELGLLTEVITQEVMSEFGLSADSGVLVKRVEEASSAARAGITPGDVILEFDNKPVTGPESFARLRDGIEYDKPVLVLLRRAAGTRFLTIRKEHEEEEEEVIEESDNEES